MSNKKTAPLKGWRTLIVSLAGALLVWLQSDAVAAFVADNPGVTATGFLVLQLALRWVTTTPIFQARAVILLPLVLFGLGGCVTINGDAAVDTPRKTYAVAVESYNTVLGGLTEARLAGAISDDQMIELRPYIASAGAAFDLWDYALRVDDPAGIEEWSKAATEILGLLQHVYQEIKQDERAENQFRKGAGIRPAVIRCAGACVDFNGHRQFAPAGG